MSAFNINIENNDLCINLLLGFIIITFYNFATYERIINKTTTTVISSFVVGYAYRYIMGNIPFSISVFWDIIGLIILGALIGISTGKFIQSKICHSICILLGIRRTSNNNIWCDFIDMNYTTKACIVMQDKKVYEGFIGLTEEYSHKPVISLYGYKVYCNGIILHDYSKVCNRIVVLDIEKALSIDIIYSINSDKYASKKQFLLKEDLDQKYSDVYTGDTNTIISDNLLNKKRNLSSSKNNKNIRKRAGKTYRTKK